MIVDCISDLHGHYPALEEGDLLIIAGDWSSNDSEEDLRRFEGWLLSEGVSQYHKIIVIAGNHDNSAFELNKWALTPYLETLPQIDYLCDSGTEFEGLKIWGSPWTKKFDEMNPNCMAFTVDTEEELGEKWALIPNDTDILITHCPPYGIFDSVGEELTGSRSLLSRSLETQAKLHVFGHIHENGGCQTTLSWKEDKCIFVNASYVDENYQAVNEPIRIEL